MCKNNNFMFKVDYTTIPEYFIDKNNDKIIACQVDITIKWLLIDKLRQSDQKMKFLKRLEVEGFLITINEKDYKVFKSFEWLKKLYYKNLKYNL